MIKMRHIVLIVLGAGCIYFVLPLIRGDDVGGQGTESILRFIAGGGPVNLVGEVEEVDQTFPNVNFLKTGLVGPFAPGLLSAEERIDIWGQEGAPLTLVVEVCVATRGGGRQQHGQVESEHVRRVDDPQLA